MYPHLREVPFFERTQICSDKRAVPWKRIHSHLKIVQSTLNILIQGKIRYNYLTGTKSSLKR